MLLKCWVPLLTSARLPRVRRPPKPSRSPPSPPRRPAEENTMTAPAHPYGFFELHVLRVQRLGPSMTRITFGGACLDASSGGADAFVTGGRDQRFKLFFPHPHQAAPVLPTDWSPDTLFPDW